MLYTPTDYARFLAGLIGEANDHIVIHYEAHEDPHIFADVKFYSTSKFHTVKLFDKLGGYIIVSPVRKHCYMEIIEYDNHFPDMAENCHGYTIYMQREFNATDADIDAILRWRSAKSIDLHNNGEANRIAYALTQRKDELKMMDLEDLTLQLEKRSFKQLNTTIFLESLKHLRWLTLVKADLDDKDFAEFAERQPSTDLFRKVYDGRIVFSRIFDEIENIEFVEHFDRITIAYYDIRNINNETSFSYAKREIVNTFGCDVMDKGLYKSDEYHGISTSSLKQYC